MQVGDLVRGTPATSPEYGVTCVGLVVGIDRSDGRILVKWNDMPKPCPEPHHYLEVINASR